MPLDFYTAAGTQPHRFRVTGNNGEIVAASEGYTEQANAHHGAAVTLEQLLRHHPDAPHIVSAWIADLADTGQPIELPEQTIVIIGTTVDHDTADQLAAGFRRWADDTNHPVAIRQEQT